MPSEESAIATFNGFVNVNFLGSQVERCV